MSYQKSIRKNDMVYYYQGGKSGKGRAFDVKLTEEGTFISIEDNETHNTIVVH